MEHGVSQLTLCRTSPDSAFQPQKAIVTFLTRENVYVYAAGKLWLAYGLAIGMSCFIVALGLIIMFIRDAAYSDNVSTTLRLAKAARIGTDINEADLDGRDPLPKYLKDADIVFTGAGIKSEEDGHDYVAVDKNPTDDENSIGEADVKHAPTHRRTL